MSPKPKTLGSRDLAKLREAFGDLQPAGELSTARPGGDRKRWPDLAATIGVLRARLQVSGRNEGEER